MRTVDVMGDFCTECGDACASDATIEERLKEEGGWEAVQDVGVDEVEFSKVPFQEKTEVTWGRSNESSSLAKELKKAASQCLSLEEKEAEAALHRGIGELIGRFKSKKTFRIPRMRSGQNTKAIGKIRKMAWQLAVELDAMGPNHFDLPLHESDRESELFELFSRKFGVPRNQISRPRRTMIRALRALSSDLETIRDVIPKTKQGQDKKRPYIVWWANELATMYVNHCPDAKSSYAGKCEFVQKMLEVFGVFKGESTIESYLSEDPPDLMELPQNKSEN